MKNIVKIFGIYSLSIWDAYRDAGGGASPYSFLPFVFSAYMGTIGVIFSPTFQMLGFLLSSVFLSILFMLLGVGLGFILKMIIERWMMIEKTN
ncbi:hypothetical protein [Ammoniphilus sp. 3BR4]|uniref:hypothetical protein n=1 Tax=Ammoniphilus sp. 3BR4 TaxID=3158265 RepID=UPI0034653D45